MPVPRKSRYALRAILELAKHSDRGPVSIADIAEAQAIPPRFLEAILNQLKQAGIATSQRGKYGGYLLARRADELTVGDVLRVVEGPVEIVACAGDDAGERCELDGNCVFLPMWEEVRKAITRVYDSTTFQDLVDRDRERAAQAAPNWVI
jgi:Rrf2 family protein